MEREIASATLSPNPRALAGSSEHSLVRFWRSAYAAYERPINHGLGFHVPQFPGALFSPNFPVLARSRFLADNRGLLSHFNEIVPLGFDQRGPAPVGFRLKQQLFLGEKKVGPTHLEEGFSVELLPLREALRLADFWRLITDGFGNDAAFLRLQLPFLATLEAEFLTAFLREPNLGRVGVVTIGIAGGAACVSCEVVASGQRGMGLSTVLSRVAQNVAYEHGADSAFFTTEHAFFGKHADSLSHYRIFERT